MKCLNCNTINMIGAKYCCKCGSELPKKQQKTINGFYLIAFFFFLYAIFNIVFAPGFSHYYEEENEVGYEVSISHPWGSGFAGGYGMGESSLEAYIQAKENYKNDLIPHQILGFAGTVFFIVLGTYLKKEK